MKNVYEITSKARKKHYFSGWLLVLLLISITEAIRIAFSISPLLLPPITDILHSFFSELFNGSLILHTAISITFIVSGGLFASLLAIMSLYLCSLSKSLATALKIISSLLHPLPGIAILPVIIIWFGIGPLAVTIIIIHSVYWPLLTNLQAGVNSMPLTWRMIAANYSINKVEYLTTIVLPACGPHAVSGMKIAWARSWRAFISAELLFGAVFGNGGLGWFINSQRVFMDTSSLFAGILMVMIVGSSIESLFFSIIEKNTIKKWGMSI